ncbi:MAG TPA: hypothetical protein PLK65_00160 [Candidatus Cloacimonas sp.]|nr:hypothetical protein [Candidatus Cloacimonas sp.]
MMTGDNLPDLLVDQEVNLPDLLVDQEVNLSDLLVDQEVNLPVFPLGAFGGFNLT